MAYIQHLVNSHAITANQAVATRGKVHKLPDSTRGLTAECVFVDGGAGGTIDVYIQTSMDFSGSTTVGSKPQVWFDVMAFHFTTAAARKILKVREETAIVADYVETVDALTDDTAISGIIGSHVRARIVSAGTAYSSGTSIDVYVRVED
jgi:hypothetical protein